jgi:hypothetical protein
MSTPTLEDVRAALTAFQEALAAEQDARAIREEKAETFLDILARFRGGVTSADLADVTRQLEAHATRLEDMIRPPAAQQPIAYPHVEDMIRPPTLPEKKEGVRMAVPQQLIDALKKIDDDTTALAGVVKGLRDQITTGMTQADVDAIKASLDQVATRLEGIAADPNNPIPPTPLPQVP